MTPVQERVKISSRDLGALSALRYSDTRISDMCLKEADLILFSRVRATNCGGNGV